MRALTGARTGLYKGAKGGVMSISREDVIHVSRLARLNLSDDEVEKFTEQLGAILEHIAKLNEVNTEGVAPTSHVLDITNVFREDAVTESPIENMAKMAPDFAKGHFRVPKVIE